ISGIFKGAPADHQVFQPPIPAAEVHSVSDNEPVIQQKTHEIGKPIGFQPRLLQDEDGGLDGGGSPALKLLDERTQGEAGIHDIFKNQHVAAVEGNLQIHSKSKFGGGVLSVVAANAHESKFVIGG